MISNWRNIYMLTIPLRIIMVFQMSFLHPDEHFQSFEVLAGTFLRYKTAIPWEFKDSPSRSILPLLLEFPLVYLNKWFSLPPITIYFLTRLVFCIVSWVVTDWCLYKIMPTKQEKLKAIFFNSVSFITLCYQSHTFSNSIETCLVLSALVIIESFREALEPSPSGTLDVRGPTTVTSALLGAIVGFGVLNRITFAAWLILPSYFVFKYGVKRSFFHLMVTALAFALTIIGGVSVDIWWFNKKLVIGMIIPQLHKFFITKDTMFLSAVIDKLYTKICASPSIVPMVNNLFYNLNADNLTLHGLHGRYTHLLINLPMMFGPLIFTIVYPKNYLRTTPFLSFASGLIILSLFPHQELRFLLPALPLGCCFVDFWTWTGVKTLGKEQTVPEKEKVTKSDGMTDTPIPVARKEGSKIVPWIIRLTIIFNLGMTVLMGVFHQGGVLPALVYLEKHNKNTNTISIWWRTYSPPLWILGDKKLSHFSEPNSEERLSKFLDYMTEDIPQRTSSVVDVQGMEPGILRFSLDGILQTSPIPKTTEVLIVAPKASFVDFLQGDSRFTFTEVYDYPYHLDFDHFDDYSEYGFDALKPGLGIWKVESTFETEFQKKSTKQKRFAGDDVFNNDVFNN